MIDFFWTKRDCEITSPIIGESLAINTVPDKLFSDMVMGDGIAFAFEGDTIYSPCDGRVSMISTTKHALGIVTNNGTEIMLHIGLETVWLNGAGFEVLVKNNAKIRKKDPLLKIDRELMRNKGIDLTTILVITNTPEYDLIIEEPSQVGLDSIVIKSKKKVK